MSSIKLAISGASGRMGQALLACLPDHKALELRAAIVEPGSAEIGQRVNGYPEVTYSADLLASAPIDVVIDFSSIANGVANLQRCRSLGSALVLGTTGFDSQDNERIKEYAEHIAIFQAANMSLGINLLSKLVEQCSSILGSEADIEIVESHHRNKIDSPSGTALSLGQVAAKGLGRQLNDADVYQRVGAVGVRPRGVIGFATIRGGDIVGNHSVQFLLPGENLQLSHQASNRTVFAQGALSAASYLAGKAPGHYSMDDLLASRMNITPS